MQNVIEICNGELHDRKVQITDRKIISMFLLL